MIDDLISRQAAIAYAISGLTREIDGEKWIRVSEVRESIKAMPPAQPERKKGKWVLIGSRLESRPYACSKCNYAFQVDTVMGKTAWNYCPNCGAEMEVYDGN